MIDAAAIPVIEPLSPDLTAVEAFRRLSRQRHCIFFDSASRDATSRYSFVAADPFAWLEPSTATPDALAEAEHQWRKYRTPTIAGLPPFQGGLAGLLSYDLGRRLEHVAAAGLDDLPTPQLALGAYDVVLAFDHDSNTGWIISQGLPETDPAVRQDRAAMRVAQFRNWLDEPAYPPRNESPRTAKQVALPDLAPQFDVGVPGITSNFSSDAYHSMVRRAVEYIHAGDIFQVNLAQRLLAPQRDSAVELYVRLREQNPAPYAGYFDGGDWQIASASPECFLTLRDGQVETRPIKGTRGRFDHPAADLFQGDVLRASEKDRAENVMIVDLLRNDLSRVCTAESVHVAALCKLETYAFVQHLVSTVRGMLRPDASPFDLLRATLPGGSITGAPKVRAMQIISELEPTARGPYCGALAYIGFDGSMDSSILIRTITAAGGWLQLPVGGGIVADSDPDDEYRETWHKARGLLRAVSGP